MYSDVQVRSAVLLEHSYRPFIDRLKILFFRYCDRFDPLIFFRFITPIHRGFRNFVHDVHPVDDLTESGILAVKMGRILMHDKELGTGRIGVLGSRHGNNAPFMFQRISKTIGLEFPFDLIAGAAHTGTVRAAALNHKAFDDLMEDQPVIEAFFTRLSKFSTVLGAAFASSSNVIFLPFSISIIIIFSPPFFISSRSS